MVAEVGQPAGSREPSAAPKLGEVLVAAGVITEDQLFTVLRIQAGESPPRRLGELMVERGLVTEDQVARAMAGQLRLGYVDLPSLALDPNVVRIIPYRLAARHEVIPIEIGRDGVLVLAMADPTNLLARDDVRAVTGRAVKPVCSCPTHVRAAIAIYYFFDSAPVNPVHATGPGTRPSAEFLEIMTESNRSDRSFIVPPAPELDLPAALIVDGAAAAGGDDGRLDIVEVAFEDALRAGASELRFEPEATGVAIRFRVDGILREALFVPKHFQVPLLRRVKALCGLDADQVRRVQAERGSLVLPSGPIDAKVRARPGLHGERITVEIVAEEDRLPLTGLGLGLGDIGVIDAAMTSGIGLIVIAGPPGSGRETTVETVMAAHRETATSADGRHAVYLGEVREALAAEMALGAAGQGIAMVIVEAGDAAGAIVRLVEAGMDRVVLATTLRAIIAQRLVRRVCADCAGSGCADCRYSGYHGRTGLFQVLGVDDHLTEQIAVQPSPAALREAIEHAGVPNFETLGERLVEAGISTADEISRVLSVTGTGCRACGAELAAEWVACPFCGRARVRERPGSDGRPRILVVDDDTDLCLALSHRLEAEGYDVAVAHTGADAFRAATELAPHAVLLDIMLPDVSGISVCRELRALAETSLVPVLFMTGRDESPIEREGFEAGGDDYLVKPIDPDRLMTRLASRIRAGVVTRR